jgi:capsular polysaccharide biosynthesis protein
MLNNDNEEISIDLKEIMLILTSKLWLIILIGIIGGVAGGLISGYLVIPKYTSSAKVYVINRQDENKITYSDLQTGEQLTKDYMILIKSRPITEKVISLLQLPLSNDELSSIIEVNTPSDTRFLSIKVTYPDAETAKNIVDTIVQVSVDAMINVMEIDKVNIFEQGNLPQEPSSPNIKIYIIIGVIMGLLLPSLILTTRYLLNDTIKSQEDIEKFLGLTLLGIIPYEERLSKKINKRKQKAVKKIA